jgi:Nif-specific regulatory protein
VSQLAYLVIREGSQWSDVFRLLPGQPATVGRAPANQIVIHDERCSRNHAEFLLAEGQWRVRDLGSRNGTLVGDQRVEGERPLEPGEVVRIGEAQLVFVYRLSDAFGDGVTVPGGPWPGEIALPGADAPEASGTARGTSPSSSDDQADMACGEITAIMHRKGQTRFLLPEKESEESLSTSGRAAGKLCRLAFELAKAPDVVGMAELALSGLFEGTRADAGGLLLLRGPAHGDAAGCNLELVASRSLTAQPYRPISDALATTVMREGEAVLARNTAGDSAIRADGSPASIDPTASVICAPIRRGQDMLGVLHLYSTHATRRPDPDDLEFTLAVAETVAVALVNLKRRQELVENLSQVRTEIVQLRERLGAQSEIIGQSPLIKKVIDEVALAAGSKATVLIRGESGVGKELVARAVHYSSPRAKNVFVCLNCAALSEELLASELFGHERGAFTGATERKIGKFEAAHQGTLMLDEIGEMSPGLQAKFLRVLEGHPFERVGGSKPITVDVRAIAATNRDLEKDVLEGRFRRDLYFRLRVVEILVPPLRKRPEDIPELANYFLQRFDAEIGRKIRGFTEAAMEQLFKYRWPGNIRELKNVVERAVVLCTGQFIGPDDLLLSKIATAGDTAESAQLNPSFIPCSLADMERRHILGVLNHTGWNKSRAANILGIERSTLDRKIRRYLLAEDSPENPE